MLGGEGRKGRGRGGGGGKGKRTCLPVPAEVSPASAFHCKDPQAADPSRRILQPFDSGDLTERERRQVRFSLEGQLLKPHRKRKLALPGWRASSLEDKRKLAQAPARAGRHSGRWGGLDAGCVPKNTWIQYSG